MAKNFYEEFQRNDFFEKEASENQNVKNTLNGLSPEVLEKIASELDAISTIEEGSLESKLAAEDNEDEEKESACECKEKDKEEKESSDEEDKKDGDEEKESADEEDKEEKESADEEDKKDGDEEKESSEDPEGDKLSAARNNANTSNADPEGDKLSAARNNANTSNADPEGDKQDEIRKQAYELAEEKLASQGLGVYDYVCQKVADEKIAAFITENAEKLAFLSEGSALQYADDIISSVNEKLG